MPATATSTAHPISEREVELLADLICGYRPSWEKPLLKYVLRDCNEVSSADLVVAAVRYAIDPRFDSPKGIKWRGPHWDGLGTRPVDVTIKEQRCDTCGKPESRCVNERPGLDDDHLFSPK